MSAIERAIQICNGWQKLADAAGVSVQAVHFWASGGRKISAEFVPKIVAATGGQVTSQELRPDIFGAAPAPPSEPQQAA